MARNRSVTRPWIESGKPTDREVRAWRHAHVVTILRLLNGAADRARRLRVLLDEQERLGAAPLRREVEAPEALYLLAMERCAKLEREVELLYLLLEARSLGTIRRGKLVIGGVVGKPVRTKLDELDRAQASRAKIEREIARLKPARRPGSPDPAAVVPGRPASRS